MDLRWISKRALAADRSRIESVSPVQARHDRAEPRIQRGLHARRPIRFRGDPVAGLGAVGGEVVQFPLDGAAFRFDAV